MFSQKSISLLIILMVGFIDIMGIGLVYPMFSSMLYQSDCHFLSAETSDFVRGTCLGVLLAAMPLTQFFSAPILGMLSDKKGRRSILLPSLGAGVFGYIIAVIGIALHSLPLLLLSRIVVGISAGSAAIVSAAMADISSSEEKAKNFGLLNMAFGLGFTVGPFLGGWLSTLNVSLVPGYAFPFALAGLATLLNMVLAMGFFKETCKTQSNQPLTLIQGIRNIQTGFRLPQLRAIFLTVFLACIGWSFFWEFIPVTWISIHEFSTSTVGELYAYGAAVYALSCGLLIRPFVSRFSNQEVLYYALILCGISIGILFFHTDKNWLWFYIPIQQFGIALFWPTAAAVISNSVAEDVQGEMLGIFQSIDSLAFSISPLIAGPLLGLSVSMPILIGSLFMLAAALVLRLYLNSVAKATAL